MDELAGAVTVVVGVVVVGVADDPDDPEEPEEPEVTVAPVFVVSFGPVAEPVDVDVVGVRTAAEEWAVVSDATNTPRPTAAAVAATPISAVIRRTRALARSRARIG